MRATAGLTAAAWTDPSLTGVIIKATHIQELRTYLRQAVLALGFPEPAYATDPGLTAGVHIKAAHVQELRNNVK